MKEVIYGVVTDCFYSTLLGLDGCASIGGVQTEYTVHDGDGLPLHGDLEAAAFSELQNDTSSPN